ncbi:hypothetical protein CFU_3586 [Collimonas fungivorans Ter331]|uniref:Uncharacterized protein n=1 Tax=Collimonas fungivorans (strain Ter331) TaxID=1005048 RepID=G0ADE8_COLFT|nr:hypothetical protein CFU_3586 [Collimonas fungivorans Ter331]
MQWADSGFGVNYCRKNPIKTLAPMPIIAAAHPRGHRCPPYKLLVGWARFSAHAVRSGFARLFQQPAFQRLFQVRDFSQHHRCRLAQVAVGGAVAAQALQLCRSFRQHLGADNGRSALDGMGDIACRQPVGGGDALYQQQAVVAVGIDQLLRQPGDQGEIAARHGFQRTGVEQRIGRLGLGVDDIVRQADRQPPLQIIESDRLEQAIVHAGRLAALDFLRLGIGGITPDHAARCLSFIADFTRQLVAAHHWHVAIRHDQIEAAGTPDLQRFPAVFRRFDVMPEVLQLLAQHQAVGDIVVSHQYAQAAQLGRYRRRLQLRRVERLDSGHGKLDQDLRPHSQLALQRDVAAHHLRQPAADGQPEAGAVFGRTRTRSASLDKRREQLGLFILRDAGAGIADLQLQRQAAVLFLLHIEADGDLAFLRELDGVADQVGQDLLEAHRVDQHLDAGIGVDESAQGQALLPRQAVEHTRHGFHQLAQVGAFRHQLQLAGFDLGDVEDVADQAQQGLGGIVGDLDRRPVPQAVLAALEHQLQHADDGVHRGPYFVAHGGQESRFGAAGFIRFFLGQLQRADQLFAFGDVDPAADQAGRLAPGILERQGPVIDPEMALAEGHVAVGEHRYAILHGPQVHGMEFLRRFRREHGRFRQQLADHLAALAAHGFQVAAVAFDQAGIEVAHIDRVRRVVDHGAHEGELVAQRPLGQFAFGDLAAQVGDPEQAGQDQQQRAGADLVDLPAVGIPGTWRGIVLLAPTVGQHDGVVGRYTAQHLVEDVAQLRLAAPHAHRQPRHVLADRRRDAQLAAERSLDKITGGDLGLDGAVHLALRQFFKCRYRLVYQHQLDAGILLAQLRHHGIAALDRQFFAVHLSQIGDRRVAAARHQHQVVEQEGLRKRQVGLALGTHQQGAHHVRLALTHRIDHVWNRIDAHHLEVKAGTQFDQAQVIRHQAVELAALGVEGQRREQAVDRHPDFRMLGDPLALGVGQDQRRRGDPEIQAHAPALQHAAVQRFRNRLEQGIKHPQQDCVLFLYGEADVAVAHRRKTIRPQHAEITLVDQEAGADGVAQENVGLVMKHAQNRPADVGIGLEGGERIQIVQLLLGQVAGHDCHAQGGVRLAGDFMFADRQHDRGAVDSIRARQDEILAGQLVLDGVAQDVDITLGQRHVGGLARRVAHDFDDQPHLLRQQRHIVCRQAIEILMAVAEIEGRMVRGDRAEPQHAFFAEPAPVVSG